MLQTSPRPGPRMTAGMTRAIALLALSSTAVLARLALAAVENPGLRVVPPLGEGPRRPLLDPDGLTAPQGSLISHVLGQIGQMRLSARDHVLALALAEALEPTGWLGVPLPAIARDCGVPLAELEAVLTRLQRMEPGGLFARTLAECLALQAEDAGVASSAVMAVLDRLPLLSKGDMGALARDAGLDLAAVQQAAGIIRSLDPKPGLAFSGPMPPPAPPDLIARRGPQGWQVLPHPGLARVEIDPAAGDRRAAGLWAQAIGRRADLGLAVARLIVASQAAHWEGSGPRRAITSAELAAAAGVHVATVNRVVRGTTLQTPAGTRPLRDWMARPLRAGGPPAVLVRQRLADLLAMPAFAALSDARLAAILEQEGLGVARRTVAKYSAALQRPPRRA